MKVSLQYGQRGLRISRAPPAGWSYRGKSQVTLNIPRRPRGLPVPPLSQTIEDLYCGQRRVISRKEKKPTHNKHKTCLTMNYNLKNIYLV